MFNKFTKLRKPRNLLLIFDVLAIGLLMLYKDAEFSRNLGIYASALIVLLYISNIILEKVTTGDSYIFMVVSMLVSIGAIINFSIDQVLGIKHLVWALVSIGGFFITYFLIKYIDIWDKIMTPLIAISIALFLITLVFGKVRGGSKNWIIIGNQEAGGFSFQPTELIKLGLIFILASFYYHKDYYKKIKHSSVIMMGVVYLFIGFLFLQKDLGTAVMFLAIFMGIQFVYEDNRMLILFSILLTVVALVMGFFLFNHVRERFYIWIDPWNHEKGEQILQSLFAISSGGFTGVGLGLGYPKLIPVVSSDMIFSAICEELGILTGISVIMMFLLLVYRSFKIAIVQRHPFYKIVAIGIAISFGVQTFLAIGGVTKFIPMTGITTPFVSYGGTSMFVSFISMGVLQVCSEELKHKPVDTEAAYD